MNLAATLTLWFGGVGSGCRGDNCGRPGKKEWKELMVEHNRIKAHPFRISFNDFNDRTYKMQRNTLTALANRIESTFGDIFKGTDTIKGLKLARKYLDEAESAYAKGNSDKARGAQEDAMMELHDTLRGIKKWQYGKNWS